MIGNESSEMAEAFRIGDWTFVPAENELRRGTERRRLEHRAARTLDLLCRRRGEIVPREAIVDEVWNGRSISPNSVAIVIGDLRAALDDDPRQALHIETLAKRGYRLRREAARSTARPRRIAALAGSAAALAAVLAVGLAFAPKQPGPDLLIADVTNDTGNPRLAPLARASTEVLLASASGIRGASVSRAGQAAATPPAHRLLVVNGRLIMWSGRPTLMLTATDRATGRLVWSGQGGGGENAIPAGVRAAMRDLEAKLRSEPAART